MAVTCQRPRVFQVAKLTEAGICGVFETQADAEKFIDKLKEEQNRNPAAAERYKAAHRR